MNDNVGISNSVHGLGTERCRGFGDEYYVGVAVDASQRALLRVMSFNLLDIEFRPFLDSNCILLLSTSGLISYSVLHQIAARNLLLLTPLKYTS